MAKKIKQSELDKAAELPRSSISKIETKKREASISECVRIAKTLGVALDMLVSDDDAFVYREEIRIIEALREIPFEDYHRILQTLESSVYFTAKDAGDAQKEHLQKLVRALNTLSRADRRPRNQLGSVKRAK